MKRLLAGSTPPYCLRPAACGLPLAGRLAVYALLVTSYALPAVADKIDIPAGRLAISSGGSVSIGTSNGAGDIVVGKSSGLTAGAPEKSTLEFLPTGTSADAVLKLGSGGNVTINSSGILRVTRADGGTRKAHIRDNDDSATDLVIFILRGTLEVNPADKTDDAYLFEDLDADGLQVYHGAMILGMNFGTLRNNSSAASGPLLNFRPTSTESNWADGTDRDKIPPVVSGVTFTGNYATAAPEEESALTGDANVKASFKTPPIRFTGYKGNVTWGTSGAGDPGTSVGGERNELDYQDRIAWDRQEGESADSADPSRGVAKIGTTFYNTLQAAAAAAADGATIEATRKVPITDNIVVPAGTDKALTLVGFVLAPKSGYAVEDKADGGKDITLRNVVVAAGGVKGLDADDRIVCQNCTIFGYGYAYDDEFSGSAEDTGVWSKNLNGGTVTVGTETVGSGVWSRVQLQDAGPSNFPVVDSVKNPFPSVGTFYVEIRFRFDSAGGVGFASGIRAFSGGGTGGTEILKISQDASAGLDVTVAGTLVVNGGVDTANAHTVKLYWSGTTYYTWYDGVAQGAGVASTTRPNFITMGNIDAQASGAWSDFDVDYIRVIGVPEVTNATLTNTIQETGDNAAASSVTANNLSLRRIDNAGSTKTFSNIALFDYHLLKPSSPPTWFPIDRGAGQNPTYTKDFDDQDRGFEGVTGVGADGASGPATGDWDIGADEYRLNNGFEVTPKFVYPGTDGESYSGAIKSFTFVGNRAETPGDIYAYFVSAGGGANPDEDNTLRLWKVNGAGANTEITVATTSSGANKRLKAPGQVLFLTYLHNGSADIRIYCVVDRNNDGKGDCIWAVQDTGSDTGTVFKEAVSGATFDFISGDSGNNNWDGAVDGDEFDNTPSTTQGVREYTPGRIGAVTALLPDFNGTARRLYFAVESDDSTAGSPTPASPYTNVLYCVNADTGATVWVSDDAEWHWRPLPAIVPGPIMGTGVAYNGAVSGQTYDVIKMGSLASATKPTINSTDDLEALPGTAAPNGSSLDVSLNYLAGASELYFATGDTSRVYRLNSSLVPDSAWSNESGPVSGISVTLDTAGSTSTNTPVQVIWGGFFHYVGAGNKLYRLRASDGQKRSDNEDGTTGYRDSVDWPMSLRGPMSTYIISNFSGSVGGWLNYFGTEAGECYAVQDNDYPDAPTDPAGAHDGLDGATGILPGWPYLVPGQRIVDVRALWGTVYFATDQGLIYGFPTQ